MSQSSYTVLPNLEEEESREDEEPILCFSFGKSTIEKTVENISGENVDIQHEKNHVHTCGNLFIGDTFCSCEQTIGRHVNYFLCRSLYPPICFRCDKEISPEAPPKVCILASPLVKTGFNWGQMEELANPTLVCSCCKVELTDIESKDWLREL